MPTPMPAVPPSPPSPAADRAAQRLATWAQRHPQAAALARLASLAVRVDASLLRRLRLQLLPRAEPGIEADLWFAGLHAAQGGGSLVFDAAVQQLLRSQLCQATAAPGQARPLQAAWDITRGLHAAWPEALRLEETLTYLALQAGDAANSMITQALQPALAAMASGGDARALEVARWAQRAMPRLPDTARQHPAVLALWLGALVRLGATSGPLPATGPDGLPPALRWLLPAPTGTLALRVACQPLADGLRLQPLAESAPDAAQQITLPAAQAMLLAVHCHGASGQHQHQTVSLQGETTVPLPPDWQQVNLHNLAGQRWQLQRQAGGSVDAAEALAWQQARVQVLGDEGPVGQGCFISATEVLTVVDALPPWVVDSLRAAAYQPTDKHPTVQLMVQDSGGKRLTRQARLMALDLRSPLALLSLQRPFADAVVVSRMPEPPPPPMAVWIGNETAEASGRWQGSVQRVHAADPGDRSIGLEMSTTLPDGTGLAGAPVFVNRMLLGLVDMSGDPGSTQGIRHVRVVPSVTIDHFLAWAHRPDDAAPQLLLHHATDDPEDSAPDAHAVQRIEAAARRARLQLLHAGTGPVQQAADAAPGDGSFAADLAGAVRLLSPVTREMSPPAARLRLLALAARRWARPDFQVLRLGDRQTEEHERLPALLTSTPLLNIEDLAPEPLARLLLDTADPPRPPAAPGSASQHLSDQLRQLAKPFLRSTSALAEVLSAAQAQDLGAVADLVSRSWNSSSRLDASPMVEVLAQLALPLPDEAWLEPLRLPARARLVLNAMPVQLGRLLIARAHAPQQPAPCVVVRDQTWAGASSVDSIHHQVAAALAEAVACSTDDATALLHRLPLAPWILITTRPLPDADTLLALQTRLPAARLLFLAGHAPDLAEAARGIGLTALPALPDGADMGWLSGYKRLLDWARPPRRSGSTTKQGRRI